MTKTATDPRIQKREEPVPGYAIEALLTNAADRAMDPSIPLRAVKLQVIMDEPPGPNEQAEWRALAVAMYRRHYQEWAKGPPTVTWKALGG